MDTSQSKNQKIKGRARAPWRENKLLAVGTHDHFQKTDSCEKAWKITFCLKHDLFNIYTSIGLNIHALLELKIKNLMFSSVCHEHVFHQTQDYSSIICKNFFFQP